MAVFTIADGRWPGASEEGPNAACNWRYVVCTVCCGRMMECVGLCSCSVGSLGDHESWGVLWIYTKTVLADLWLFWSILYIFSHAANSTQHGVLAHQLTDNISAFWCPYSVGVVWVFQPSVKNGIQHGWKLKRTFLLYQRLYLRNVTWGHIWLHDLSTFTNSDSEACVTGILRRKRSEYLYNLSSKIQVFTKPC